MSYPALRIELSPSRRLAVVLGLAHAGALVCVFALGGPALLQVALGAAVIASASHSVCRHALLCAPASVTTLLWDSEGLWEIATRRGEVLEATLLSGGGLRAGSYVHPALTVLNFQVDRWRRVAVVLLPDRVEKNAFRRLRVRLRFEGRPKPEVAP